MIHLVRSRRGLLTCLLVIVTFGLVCEQPVRAAEPVKETSSLSFIPADAAFYGSSLRNREQYDRLVNSKAFARIKAMPFVQQMLVLAQLQLSNPSNPLGRISAALEDPQNSELLKLVGDMVSHEIFVYGDADFSEAVALFVRINSANQLATVQALVGGGADQSIAQRRGILLALNQNRDRLKIPAMVIGFKLSDAAPAKTQLKRLEDELQAALAQQAQLAGRFKRTTIAGSDYLTLSLDGSLVPWNQLQIGDLEKTPGEFDELIAKLKKLTLSIALGVRGEYLLLSIGSSNNHLGTLGKGSLLYDRTELASLRKSSTRPLTSISYMSRDFAAKVNQVKQQIDNLVKMAKTLLPMAPLEAGLKKELTTDIDTLAKTVVELIPKPGAKLSFTFLTDRGYEGYDRDWGENKYLDGSKRLSLLDHVGEDPIFFSVSRCTYNPEHYDMFVKFMQRAFYYGESYALTQMTDQKKAIYQQAKLLLIPFLKQTDKINRASLIPAFKDGQSAFVIDAKTKSVQWHRDMPPAQKPLPILELGLVYGVSDPGLLRKAMRDYYAAGQDLINNIQKQAPVLPPGTKIPGPQTKPAGEGTIYYYPLKSSWGLDPLLSPNAGLSGNVLALSLTHSQTQRLLKATPLSAGYGPLANRNRPLAGAASFDFPVLVDALTPWIEYGVGTYLTLRSFGQPVNQDAIDATMQPFRPVLEVLKCYRGGTSVHYFEGDVLVRHRESVFQDLK